MSLPSLRGVVAGAAGVACLAGAIGVSGSAMAQARSTDDPGSFPTPAVADDAWSLDFAADLPRLIAVQDPSGDTHWYWYVTYTVTNFSGADRNFIPEFTVLTQHGHILTAGVHVPARVYPAIEKRLRNPFLQSPQEVIGTLRQGEYFAKDSVAIWPVPEGDVDQFTLFVTGLSGESAVLTQPSTGEPVMAPALDIETGEPLFDEQGNPVMRPVIARRTTALTYSTPGTPDSPQLRPVTLLDTTDVMR